MKHYKYMLAWLAVYEDAQISMHAALGRRLAKNNAILVADDIDALIYQYAYGRAFRARLALCGPVVVRSLSLMPGFVWHDYTAQENHKYNLKRVVERARAHKLLKEM